jgi:hypothetical protein
MTLRESQERPAGFFTWNPNGYPDMEPEFCKEGE